MCGFVGVIIGVVLSCGIAYVLYSQEVLNIKSVEVQTKDSKNEMPDQITSKTEKIDYTFDSSKVVNPSAESYTLIVLSRAACTNISLDSSQTKVTVSINHYLISQNYGLGWVTSL